MTNVMNSKSHQKQRDYMNKINGKAKARETFSGEKAELCLLMLFFFQVQGVATSLDSFLNGPQNTEEKNAEKLYTGSVVDQLNR